MGQPAEGDVIYLLTDGDDNARKDRPNEVVNGLLDRNARVFTLSIGQHHGLPVDSLHTSPDPPILDGLPARSGGTSIFVLPDRNLLRPFLKDEKGILTPGARTVDKTPMRMHCRNFRNLILVMA